MHIRLLVHFSFLSFFDTKIIEYFTSFMDSRIYSFRKLLFKYARSSYNSPGDKKYINSLCGFVSFYKDILWFYDFRLNNASSPSGSLNNFVNSLNFFNILSMPIFHTCAQLALGKIPILQLYLVNSIIFII